MKVYPDLKSIDRPVDMVEVFRQPDDLPEIARDAVVKGRSKVLGSVRMTKREQEVIALIAEGMSNKEIASKLHIATHTVKSHVRNIMEKLALHTRLQIAAYAHKGEITQS